MAVTAQTGVFSFGGQTAKGSAATSFYKHRAADIDLASISDDRLGPPEVGGDPVPTFPYRAGVLVTGGSLLYPRLENTFGWLLHGAVGAWSQTTDKDIFESTISGMHNHEFVFATDKAFVPWMTFRKHIPGTNATNSLGEQYNDCKIVSLAVALPNEGPISARIDVLGRTPGYDDNPSWTYQNTQFEDWESIPVSCVTSGYLKVPGFSASELPIVAATCTLANIPLDIRQERVFGSPYLEDVTIIGRAFTVDMVLKWTDPQLYSKIFTGLTNGTEWAFDPFTADLDVVTISSRLATGMTNASWGLRIRAAELMYNVVGGIRLAGNQALMMRVQGQAIQSTQEFVTYNLANTVNGTAYTWPT